MDSTLDTVKILLGFSFAIMNKTFRDLKWIGFSNLGGVLYLACVSTEQNLEARVLSKWHTGRERAELKEDPGFCCSNGAPTPSRAPIYHISAKWLQDVACSQGCTSTLFKNLRQL